MKFFFQDEQKGYNIKIPPKMKVKSQNAPKLCTEKRFSIKVNKADRCHDPHSEWDFCTKRLHPGALITWASLAFFSLHTINSVVSVPESIRSSLLSIIPYCSHKKQDEGPSTAKKVKARTEFLVGKKETLADSDKGSCVLFLLVLSPVLTLLVLSIFRLKVATTAL